MRIEKYQVKVKNIVIAAGYATRLGELTKNFPKPLLKIGNSTILDRMLDDIDTIDDIDEHIVVTNHKFAPIFQQLGRRPRQQCACRFTRKEAHHHHRRRNGNQRDPPRCRLRPPTRN